MGRILALGMKVKTVSAFVTVSSRGWLAGDGGWGLMGRGSVRREMSGLKVQGAQPGQQDWTSRMGGHRGDIQLWPFESTEC